MISYYSICIISLDTISAILFLKHFCISSGSCKIYFLVLSVYDFSVVKSHVKSHSSLFCICPLSNVYSICHTLFAVKLFPVLRVGPGQGRFLFVQKKILYSVSKHLNFFVTNLYKNYQILLLEHWILMGKGSEEFLSMLLISFFCQMLLISLYVFSVEENIGIYINGLYVGL